MQINRKKFILSSAAGIGAFTALGTAIFTDPRGIVRKDMPLDPKTENLKKTLGEKRVEILHLASLAPSPHNTQPWKVKIINKDTWILSADPSRCMTATDPLRHRLMIAMGAFLENLSIAAGAAGFDAQISITAKKFTDNAIAEIKLTKAALKPYPVERLIFRKTVKNGFLGKKLQEAHIKKLSDSLKGHFFYFPHETEHGACIRESAVQSFQAWLDSSEAQKEHVSWLRMSNSFALQKRDGLTADGMEIKGIAGWFIRTFMSEKSWAGSFMKNESMKFTNSTSQEGAGYAVITALGNNPAGIIETGRRFERMALGARELNIGIQPMTQALEMESGHKGIRSNHSRAISPQLILRIGYVENYPDPVSLRRPAGWFTS